MLRTENDLLKGLLNTIKESKYATDSNNLIKTPKPLNEKEKEEIEKYRDKDGFINLKNVKNPKDIVRIFDIVDRKNHIEELENEKSAPNGIMDFISDLFEQSLRNGANKYTITTTPNGISVKLVDTLDEENENEVQGTVDTENVTKVDEIKEPNPMIVGDVEIPLEGLGEVCHIPSIEEKFNELDESETIVMLDNLSGVHTPLFYNAVRHICETQYFPKNGVYTYQELTPEEADLVIILPNVWGKITSEFIETYEKFLNDGHLLYVIDPESFQCTKINTLEDLWGLEMSALQEEMN